MIRRSRPKYLLYEDIKESKKIKTKINVDFYLDRGCSALKFLLKSLVDFHNKRMIVCMQSFNCNTVLEASLEVENIKVLLSDVKLEDFSISLKFIEENKEKIDILFLLHYQGKINKEYNEIINFCYKNNIIVIEDLAHVPESNHVLRGDYGIYSYSFDKPFTCHSGGKIIVKNKKTTIFKFIQEKYIALDYENYDKSNYDIKLLDYLFTFSSISHFFNDIDNMIIVEKLLRIFSITITYRILNNKILRLSLKVIFKIYFKFFKNYKNKQYPVLRLLDAKIYLLEKQSNRFLNEFEKNINLQGKIIDKLESILIQKIDKKTEWNRLSFIDVDKKIKFKNIEYNNFNWSIPLDVLYAKNNRVLLSGNYVNTLYLSKNIINFPIWTDKIIDEFN